MTARANALDGCGVGGMGKGAASPLHYLRALHAEQWEFFDAHPRARVFRPESHVLVTLFYQGSIPTGVFQKWARLWREYRGQATFRSVNINDDVFDGERYCVDRTPCIYVELEGSRRLTRVLGRMTLPTLKKTVTSFL